MFRKIIQKLSFFNFRQELKENQFKILEEIKELNRNLFIQNPVMVIGDVQIFLPLFYVDHIQKIIYQTRTFYEIETLETIKKEFKQFENVVDIGTNIGNHLLFWCSEMGAKKVYCFEPNEYSRSVLNKNIDLNHLNSFVKVYSCGLGAEEGKGFQSNFTYSNTGMNRITMIDSSSEGTDIKRLDDLSIEAIDFIKIDVEGFEVDVLKGASSTILKYKPVIMVEVFDSNRDPIDNIMLELGYKKKMVLEGYNIIYIPSL